MADKNAKAHELLADADEYLLLVPTGEEFKYVWVVNDEESKARFQQALAKFQESE